MSLSTHVLIYTCESNLCKSLILLPPTVLPFIGRRRSFGRKACRWVLLFMLFISSLCPQVELSPVKWIKLKIYIFNEQGHPADDGLTLGLTVDFETLTWGYGLAEIRYILL